MRSILPLKTCGVSAWLVVFPLFAAFALVPATLAQDAPPTEKDHLPPVSSKINSLAHRLMEAGVKTNALRGDDLKPWHLKMDYQMLPAPGSPKPISGTVEEWYAGPYQWKRSYTGAPGLNGTEWSVSKTERYQSKPPREGFSHVMLNLRIARPVIDPLYQTANIKPDYEMEVSRVNTAGIVLNCVSVVNPSQYLDPNDDSTNPDWLFPTLCFDDSTHLRVVSTSDTMVQFDDIQAFQNRAVARDVKVISKGNLLAEMKVSVLEPNAATDAGSLKPSKDAIPQPFTIEPGFPRPESVFELGAHIPLKPDGYPYRGTMPVPITIHKDGSVKVRKEGAFFQSGALQDAIELAVNKWKYKPYLVDGEPAEVAITVGYVMDGKQFVPSYEHPKAAPVSTSPEDYTSAYDPKRDPAKDLAKAMDAAAQAHKRILLDVGGNWCIWCKVLDKFFADHEDLRQLRDANFVLIKVNMSGSNENGAFLSQFPKIPGYPFLFVLDSAGKLVRAENTDDLQDGDAYSVKRIRDFLTSMKAQ